MNTRVVLAVLVCCALGLLIAWVGARLRARRPRPDVEAILDRRQHVGMPRPRAQRRLRVMRGGR